MLPTYELIASQTLGSNAASVTFAGIPQTYDDLLLVASTRTTSSIIYAGMLFQFNGDSANHSYRLLYGEGSSGTGSSSESNVGYVYGFNPGATATANTFGNCCLYIPNYANTSANKSCSLESVSESNNSAMAMGATAGLWASNSAITSIKISSGTNLATGSSAYLFGIREETA